MLWFDLATSTPILISLFFLFEVLENKNLKKNLIISGIFLSIAALIKQTSAIFFLVVIIILFLRKIKLKDFFHLLIGPFIILLAFLIRLIQEKAFFDFLNWVLIYPSKYWIKFPGYVQMNMKRGEIITIMILFIPLLILLFSFKKIFKDKFFVLTIIFLLCSFLTVYPRFSFFHFQPALAILPLVIAFIVKQEPKILFYITTLLLLFFSFRNIYPKIKSDWGKETRFIGFEEKALSSIIKNNTSKEERVLFLGLNSNLYSLSERVPPKRWFDNFGWYLEIDRVQEEIIERWNDNLPRVIFWKKPLQGEWYELGVYQPKKITDYIIENYNMDVEVYPDVYLWRIKDI
ncbi:hypothetical protein ACFL15_00780 [Patescibacteria group bacterium]